MSQGCLAGQAGRAVLRVCTGQRGHQPGALRRDDLHFEAEKEDGLRSVGFSKERRVDPQIVVELSVDWAGFPLKITCFEESKAEKATILPAIEAFKARHEIENMVVVADAGILSATNLTSLDEAAYRFIVGSRVAKAPIDLESRFLWHGAAFTDGHVIDTLTPKIGKNADNDTSLKSESVCDSAARASSCPAVCAYSAKRAAQGQQDPHRPGEPRVNGG